MEIIHLTDAGRITAAAPDVAIALGYDVAAAPEELDEITLRVSAEGREMTDLLAGPVVLHAYRWVVQAIGP